MTELKETKILPNSMQDFILHWGDMGSHWGVNRTVAQIHALLFLSDRALNAEEISKVLGVARSNVSNSLKELSSWKLITRTPIANDRRDHFEAVSDVWTMVQRIVEGRKQREIDPAKSALENSISLAKNDPIISQTALNRMEELKEFISLTDQFYEQMNKIPQPKMMALLKLGNRILKYLPIPK